MKQTSGNLIKIISAILSFSFSTQVQAASFQLWEQDAATPGNYHAGYAVGQDASTTFYNPAGITQINHQQLIFGTLAVATSFKFKGTMEVNTLLTNVFPTTAQGGSLAFIPFLNYVAPISDKVGFGLSVNVPFGLKTDYPLSSEIRYAATLSELKVIDISPALAVQVNDKLSVGLGIDFFKSEVTLEMIVGGLSFDNDSKSRNELHDRSYGFHLGALYQFTPQSRVGLSYHSQSAIDFRGKSKLTGPVATLIANVPDITSRNARAGLTLPAYTALSFYQCVSPHAALLATVIYTQWSVIDRLQLRNAAGLSADKEPTKSLTITIPEHYRNTWNATIGTEIYATKEITLRGGVGYDETPVRDTYRTVHIPDKDRYVLALGGHYQATSTIGFDLSWLHVFGGSADINPPPQVAGEQITTTRGRIKGGADVYGAQMVWDLT